MTSSKHIYRGSRKKSLEIQLLQPNIPRSSYLTSSHTLSHSTFNPCSCCIHYAKFRSFLAFTRFLECVIGMFIWTQNKHFCRSWGALRMKRTIATDKKREPYTKTRLSMPIRDMTPISTFLPFCTHNPFCFPINEKVAVIKAPSFF